jgi:hypothetical protein
MLLYFDVVRKVADRLRGFVRVLRECGRFHEPEQRGQPEPCAGVVRYSVGRAVCTHRQQLPRVYAARTLVVWAHLYKTYHTQYGMVSEAR